MHVWGKSSWFERAVGEQSHVWVGVFDLFDEITVAQRKYKTVFDATYSSIDAFCAAQKPAAKLFIDAEYEREKKMDMAGDPPFTPRCSKGKSFDSSKLGPPFLELAFVSYDDADENISAI